MKVPQISKSTYEKIIACRFDYETARKILEAEKSDKELEILKGHTYTFILETKKRL
jgi:hypothetical protein